MRRSKPMPLPSHHSAFHLHPSLTPGQKALVQASREFGERSGLGGELALWLYGLWWEAVESSCLQVAALPGKAALGKGIYRLGSRLLVLSTPIQLSSLGFLIFQLSGPASSALPTV